MVETINLYKLAMLVGSVNTVWRATTGGAGADSNQVALTTYLLVHSTQNPEFFSEYEFGSLEF